MRRHSDLPSAARRLGNILASAKTLVVITEGEIKAASASAHGIPCAALGGVWSFGSKRAGVELDPALARIAAGGRPVVIAFDSDAATKPGVAAAQTALALRLSEAGAAVRVDRLPQASPDDKTGLDDLIVARGAEAAQAAIDAAEEFEGERALHRLNDGHVLVRNPVCIYARGAGSMLSEAQFRLLARNQTVTRLDRQGRPARVDAGTAWLEWPRRLEARAMVYEPGEPEFTADGALNVWPGWGCESVEGDVRPWRELLDHLFVGAEPGLRDWFERWCAYPVQRPGAKIFSAPVLVSSAKGVGKSLVAELLAEVYGVRTAERRGTCAFITPKELGSSFSEWLLGTSLVVCEEMSGDDYRSRRALMDKLKDLITGATTQINEKNVPRFVIANRANLMFLTNHLDSLRVEDGDRRFFVHLVTAPPMAIEAGGTSSSRPRAGSCTAGSSG